MPGTLPTFMCEYSPERIPPLQMVILPPLGWLTPPPPLPWRTTYSLPLFFLFSTCFHSFCQSNLIFIFPYLSFSPSLPLSLPPSLSPSLFVPPSLWLWLPLFLLLTPSPSLTIFFFLLSLYAISPSLSFFFVWSIFFRFVDFFSQIGHPINWQ